MYIWMLVILVFALFLIYVIRANHHIQVTVRKYVNGKLPEAFAGFRIVQLSDIHADLPGKKAERIMQAVRQSQPDIVVITGDVVDHVHNKPRQFARAQKLLQDLGREFQCYYVTGNHEYMHPECEEMIPFIEQHTDIHVLHDSVALLERGGQQVHIWGVDDPYALYQGKVPAKYCTPAEQFKQKLQKHRPQKEAFHILLSHRPEFFETYVNQGFDLVFTGHAHGGQFRGPFGVCVIAPDQGLFPKLTQHFHCSNGTTMYISRGLGNSVVPLRLFNDPEIVVVECFPL